jgi:hypothetical protein
MTTVTVNYKLKKKITLGFLREHIVYLGAYFVGLYQKENKYDTHATIHLVSILRILFSVHTNKIWKTVTHDKHTHSLNAHTAKMVMSLRQQIHIYGDALKLTSFVNVAGVVC